MATASDVNFQLIDDIDSLRNAISELKGYSELAVDCEGVKLSRTGKLCLIQVATGDKVLVFDMIALGRKTLDQGLGDILKNGEITKVFFDCREDCNALKQQYGVNVEGIMDIQIMEVILRTLTGNRTTFVFGLMKTLHTFLPGCGFSDGEKEEMHKAFSSDAELWTRRPLRQKYLEYAARDVFYLLALKNKFMSKITAQGMPLAVATDITKYSSERYADFVRDNDAYVVGSVYFGHPRLPLKIIPQISPSMGDYTPCGSSGRKCTTCGQRHQRSTAKCSRCIAIDQVPRRK